MRYPTLVSAAPLEKALQKLQSDIATLRAVAPEAAALPGLERHAKALAEAMEEASRADTQLTVDEVATIEKVTAQAVRRRLKQGLYKGALRRGGVWRVPSAALYQAA
jgi:hypothetical protein